MNLAQRLCSAAPAALVAITVSGVPCRVHADSGADLSRQIVRYGDLNLSNPAAVRTLYNRVQAAAQSVCGPSEITGSRIVPPAWKVCVSDTIRHTILKINQPQLTTYYAQSLGVLPTQARAVPER